MDSERSSTIHIGTSGWHYDHWIGPFYPERYAKTKFLGYYSERFNTVEINNSFYRLPLQRTFENWRDQVPDGFVFSVKASRFITHMKKLKDPEQSVEAFFQRVKELKNKLGPILFQLPPRWRFARERFEVFLEALPSDYKYAFEFRDLSWLNSEAFDLLSERGMALCVYDFGEVSAPKKVTADFVYVRLHGPGGPYEGKYSSQELHSWAIDIRRWNEGGKEVFCYFDNDQYGYAPENAAQLLGMVRDRSLK
jgi:uncharacterized protein YecE (DUF72 family)